MTKKTKGSILFKRLKKEEEGSQTLEFIAMFPFILLSMMLVWQTGLIAYTIVVAETAVRDGARVAAVEETEDGSYQDAVRKSAVGLHILSIEKQFTQDGTSQFPKNVKVILRVKILSVNLPVIDRKINLDYTAQAVMPYEKEGLQ